jgi:hypothetical protein
MFWLEFGILLTAALIGGVAVLPYSLRLLPDQTVQVTIWILLLSAFQSAVLFGLTIGLGLLAAHAIGLGAPYIEAALTRTSAPPVDGLIIGVSLGVVVGAVLLFVDLFFFLPYWPQALRTMAFKTTLFENVLASFYGGVNEELLIRLFGLSVLAWLLSHAWRRASGSADLVVFWTANVVMAVLFGIAHLPALKVLLGNIPPLMLVRTLLLNAPVGLVCGWLFWAHGIEAAIFAHFSADLVYHAIGTEVLLHTFGTDVN